MFVTIFWSNRKFCSLSSTFKAEARFRVKTKIRPEVTISEQFQSNISGAKKCFISRWWNLRGWQSSVDSVRVLVLTHNFEMKRPVVVRLVVFAICELWFPWGHRQNCKSKQAGNCKSKQNAILLKCSLHWLFPCYINNFQSVFFRIDDIIHQELFWI